MTTTKLNIVNKLTWENYKKSEYSNVLASNFGYEHLKEITESKLDKFAPQVIIVAADKETNYGLDFKAVLKYKSNDVEVSREMSYGGMTIKFQ
jgi:hypothetical protein